MRTLAGEPVSSVDEPLSESVTQWPVRHQTYGYLSCSLITGNKLYCLVNCYRGTCVRTACPGLLNGSAPCESRTSDFAITSLTCYHYIAKPKQNIQVFSNAQLDGFYWVWIFKKF